MYILKEISFITDFLVVVIFQNRNLLLYPIWGKQKQKQNTCPVLKSVQLFVAWSLYSPSLHCFQCSFDAAP